MGSEACAFGCVHVLVRRHFPTSCRWLLVSACHSVYHLPRNVTIFAFCVILFTRLFLKRVSELLCMLCQYMEFAWTLFPGLFTDTSDHIHFTFFVLLFSTFYFLVPCGTHIKITSHMKMNAWNWPWLLVIDSIVTTCGWLLVGGAWRWSDVESAAEFPEGPWD